MASPDTDTASDTAVEVVSRATDPTRRLSSDERREQIVLAALAVFGARGYVGTTTDEVARAAGVSQPYVVRLFGSKESLFLAALGEALQRLLSAFRAAIEASDDDAPLSKRIGTAYVRLLEVRGLHQTLSHAFLLGSHPTIGPAARSGFAEVWQLIREAGFTAEEGRSFLAEGMLINTMIGLRLVDDYGGDPRTTELFEACFPEELSAVLAVVPRSDEPW
ncbi:TetR/AcrR family transcriptional regulator [Microbacterium sp. CJ88]|uniref:TetR/AcrR family transcriptional regulator n=1 Tax=Microbacterium sp. CJ88 TaxID=3445672 RepID=UPI003F65F85F